MTFDVLSLQAPVVRLAVMLTGALMCSVISAKAEYRVNIGDTLEISVAGVPELRQRVVVQLDGSIAYPLLGNTFVVAGLSPSEVRGRIRAILPTKVFRQRTPDGRENVVAIEPDQVTANVVEYRPIYVNGDVSKPGEQVYRPLMTAHQAVAVAGGYEIMRFRMNNPFLDSADFRSDYEVLSTEFAKEQAHIWRLKTELGDEEKPDQNSLREVPLPSGTISEITRLEVEQLKGRQVDYQREKGFLQNGINLTNEHIGVLSDQLQKESTGLQADTEDLQRAVELFKKGAVPIGHITDARRALLLSSTRKLQTTAELLRVKRQRNDVSRQFERLDDQRRIDLRRELEEAELKRNQIRARLQSVREKIEYTALVRSQLVRGGSEGKPQISVIRKGEKDWEHFLASEETELEPGDVVEVALRPEHGIVTPLQSDTEDHH